MKKLVMGAVLMMALPTFAETVNLVDYFAGKDEVCGQSKSREVGGLVKRFIEVTDVYSKTDRESYCTVVIVNGNGEQAFSASPAKCAEVRERLKNNVQNVIVDVVNDHICGI